MLSLNLYPLNNLYEVWDDGKMYGLKHGITLSSCVAYGCKSSVQYSIGLRKITWLKHARPTHKWHLAVSIHISGCKYWLLRLAAKSHSSEPHCYRMTTWYTLALLNSHVFHGSIPSSPSDRFRARWNQGTNFRTIYRRRGCPCVFAFFLLWRH